MSFGFLNMHSHVHSRSISFFYTSDKIVGESSYHVRFRNWQYRARHLCLLSGIKLGINSRTMHPSNIVLWCFAFLFVSSSSKSQENSTNSDEGNDNSTLRYDPFISFVENQNMEPILCNSCENFMNNINKIENKSSVNSTKNDREQNNQMSMESYANSTEISYSILQETNENLTETEGNGNSMSNRVYGNSGMDDNNKTTIIPYEACKNITCIQLCCPFGDALTLRGKCVSAEKNYNFPSIFAFANNSQSNRLNERFSLTVHDPCVEQEVGRLYNDPNNYLLFPNGTLYQYFSNLILPKSYCLAFLMDFKKRYDVITCTEQTKLPIYISACLLVSLPFLLLTFVVYSILPELQTMHGYTLRAHVASLFVTYAIMYFGQQHGSELVELTFCVPLAYIFNFTFLSSFFWLNVTCFDIWWTFSGLRSHQTGKSRDKKKFIIYSLYAWGITFIINVICAIMDAPGIPETYIRPEMCRKKFWISENSARTVYFYVPMSFTIITNICFFIVTSVTLLRQNKYITSQLRISESKRHNENKRRFKMYLKLFIVMGVSWVMELLSWFIGFNIALEISYPTMMLNALQGVIIFIIFACKKRIKKMFLKRYSGRSCLCFKIPTYDDSVTTTTSTSASMTQVSMQEIRSPN